MAGLFLFFFQAEDGIRDLVRSRGLGDVYKRQAVTSHISQQYNTAVIRQATHVVKISCDIIRWSVPVSYTHLTLPTSDLV